MALFTSSKSNWQHIVVLLSTAYLAYFLCFLRPLYPMNRHFYQINVLAGHKIKGYAVVFHNKTAWLLLFLLLIANVIKTNQTCRLDHVTQFVVRILFVSHLIKFYPYQ